MTSQTERMPAQGSEPEDNHQILWPTIFFWMVSFALNSISQPTGRVLGLPYRHPSILRSSPIICAFDVINILASWVAHIVSPLAKPASIRHSATRILLYRIVNKEGKPDIQAIRNIKAQSRVRWVIFLLGTVPQFIKLFSSNGVPWSQAIGATYLASWLLFEILVLSAVLDDDIVQSIKTLSRPGEDGMRMTWAVAAMVLHMIIYSLPANTLIDILHRSSSFSSYAMLFFLFLTFAYPLWVGCFIDTDLPPGPRGASILITGGGFLFILPLISLIQIEFVYELLFGIIVSTQVEITAFFIQNYAGEVLITIQALSVLIQPFFFYIWLYDPAGTYQPSWLKWLG